MRRRSRESSLWIQRGGLTTKLTFLDQSETFFLQAGWCQPAKQKQMLHWIRVLMVEAAGERSQGRLWWFDLREMVSEGSLVSWL